MVAFMSYVVPSSMSLYAKLPGGVCQDHIYLHLDHLPPETLAERALPRGDTNGDRNVQQLNVFITGYVLYI